MTYPAGGTLLYSYDDNGRVKEITGATSGQSVVYNVTYYPFGRVKGWTWGNGATYSRGFDLDGRISSYTSSSTLARRPPRSATTRQAASSVFRRLRHAALHAWMAMTTSIA